MKRLLHLSLFLSITTSIIAQNCTPDNSITEPGVYPTQPDTAYADQSYDFSFQILAIKDTAITYAGQPLVATIDSIKVKNVMGLPASFAYVCNNSRCVFTYQAVGCVNLYGSPTQSDAGVYDIKIATTVYANAGILKLPVPDTLEGYQLIVKGDGSSSIQQLNSKEISIYPNPSQSGKYYLEHRGGLEHIEIRDVHGKIVDYQIIKQQNRTVINLSEVSSGMYFLRAFYEGNQATYRLIR